MKLNPDLIRDLLLYIESEANGVDIIYFAVNNLPKINESVDYTPSEVFYHLNQCDMSGFLVKTGYVKGTNFRVLDLHPKGHSFIANIRDNNNWNKTKSVAVKVGSFSLDALTQIASQVISNLITGK